MKKEGTFIGSSSRTAAKKHSPAKQKRNRRSTKKRIRRVIPEEKEYIDGMPTIKDVVAGRGGGSNSHPGNRAYWQIILPNRELYKKSQTNEDKTRVAQEIVDFTKSKSGRFLQKEKGVGERWFVLPDNIAMSKVRQALRDNYIPKWARQGLRVRWTVHGRFNSGVIISDEDDEAWTIAVDNDAKSFVCICKTCQKQCISASNQYKCEDMKELLKTGREGIIYPTFCHLCIYGENKDAIEVDILKASLGESDIAFENDEKHYIDNFLVPPAEDPPKGDILPDEVSEYDVLKPSFVESNFTFENDEKHKVDDFLSPSSEDPLKGYILPDEVSEYDLSLIHI